MLTIIPPNFSKVKWIRLRSPFLKDIFIVLNVIWKYIIDFPTLLTFNQNMLTKIDLKEIRDVVREEVEAEVGNAKDELDSRITRVEIRNSYELGQINHRLKNLEIGVARLEKGQKKIQKDLNSQINFLDKDHLSNLRRIKRIEEHLHLSEN